MREVADLRVHGTTGESPVARFKCQERQALRRLNGRPPLRQLRELSRRVQNDACVDVDTNHYSVPWKLVGAEVSVMVSGGQPPLRAGQPADHVQPRRGRLGHGAGRSCPRLRRRSRWNGSGGDQVVATAILDRLLHHSHVLTIRGDSYRLRGKRRSGLLKATPAPASAKASQQQRWMGS